MKLEIAFSMVNPGGFWFEVMKDKSLNVPATLDIAPQKITQDKSHLQSSVFCLNQMKITHSTGNYIFYGQCKWNFDLKHK